MIEDTPHIKKIIELLKNTMEINWSNWNEDGDVLGITIYHQTPLQFFGEILENVNNYITDDDKDEILEIISKLMRLSIVQSVDNRHVIYLHNIDSKILQEG